MPAAGETYLRFLKEGHTFAAREMTSDPLLAQLYNAWRDPCVLGSVRQAIPGTAFVETLDLVENVVQWAAYGDGCFWSHRQTSSRKRDRSKSSRRLYNFSESWTALLRIGAIQS